MKYIDNDAFLSDCGKYRYMLRRVWDRRKPVCLFIGLNPSTADATEDDPTIRRCVRFANDWGYGTLMMGNLFAFRATDPKTMMAAADPVGPLNDRWLKEIAKGCGCVVAAWGNNGSLNGRDREVLSMLETKVYHLGLTKNKQPRHPLYLRADTEPTLWVASRRLGMSFTGITSLESYDAHKNSKYPVSPRT